MSKKNKKGLSDREILRKQSKFSIPISSLRKKPLTTYEALIVHLKGASLLNYHNIAVVLDRDERDVRKIYFRAKKKLKNVKFQLKERLQIGLDSDILRKHSKLSILISSLRKKPLTIYGALIVYLKDDSGFNYHNIGVILGRSEIDVRKVYLRAKKKIR